MMARVAPEAKLEASDLETIDGQRDFAFVDNAYLLARFKLELKFNSREKLAKRYRVTTSTLSYWLSGKLKHPPASIVRKMGFDDSRRYYRPLEKRIRRTDGVAY